MKQLLLHNKLKVLDTVKANILSNLKVPHPTLVAVGISAADTAIVVGIFYMADTGMYGIEDAEARQKSSKRL